MSIVNFEAEIAFLKSALQSDSPVTPNEQILEWIKKLNSTVNVKVKEVSLSGMKRWSFDQINGDLKHQSGKFFSIQGINIKTNFGIVSEWDQPIINQPEIGYLGILTKKFDGVLHLLMQAKIEPGNINKVQVSPTLQATKSNYTLVHKGNSPDYLEYFNGEKKVKILIDQLQSEQGARFLKKRNRNIIIELDHAEDVLVRDNFIWMTLGQLKNLIKMDNVVNMDSRTVIASISFGSYNTETLKFYDTLSVMQNSANPYSNHYLQSILNDEIYYKSTNEIIRWITKLKSSYDLDIRHIGLNKVQNWINDGNTISHEKGKYFSVIGVSVEIENREVYNWDQPMIKPAQEGLIAFLVKKIHGVYHFLVQAKLEAGNFDIIELAPTVQCLTGNYKKSHNEYEITFINDVLDARPEQIWYSNYQSEEGGRFYQEKNLNMIVEVRNDFSVEVPDNYFWMTLNQLLTFMKYNNYLNIATRSLIAAVNF